MKKPVYLPRKAMARIYETLTYYIEETDNPSAARATLSYLNQHTQIGGHKLRIYLYHIMYALALVTVCVLVSFGPSLWVYSGFLLGVIFSFAVLKVLNP